MDAISGLVPKTTITVDTVDQLMANFKLQAKANKDTATAQRVLRDCTQAERVIKEEQDLENATQMKTQCWQVTPSPMLQVEYTKDTPSVDSTLPHITQDKYKAPWSTCINREEQECSHKISCSNAWRSLVSTPHSHQDRQL
jgi:hypothetical protein